MKGVSIHMHSAVLLLTMNPLPPIHHIAHSSVLVMETGQCLEVRRGSLRHFAIPYPMIWNSLEDWRANAPYIQSDLLSRLLPHHFTADQLWMAQWHEESSLIIQEDTDGVWKLLPNNNEKPNILITDYVTGTMIPVYMCLQTGIMWACGHYFSQFSDTFLQITEVWRFELGTYYRVYSCMLMLV